MDIFGSIFNIFTTLTINDVLHRALNLKLDSDKIKYFGLSNIPSERKRGYIIISNHSHFLDYTILRPILDCYCVSFTSLFIRNNLQNVDYEAEYSLIFYDYSKESGTHVKQRILELVNSGKNVLVFPEGYSWSESNRRECLLKKFKLGLFRLAYEHNIDILPISQQHEKNNEITYFDDYKLEVFLGIKPDMPVDVTVHELISPNKYSSALEFMDECHRTVALSLHA
jgi:1-acyl-sn-glycerol-3-phosphate acyltransferase